MAFAFALTITGESLAAENRSPSEYAPVLQSVLEQALPIDAETGLYTQEIKSGVVVCPVERLMSRCGN